MKKWRVILFGVAVLLILGVVSYKIVRSELARRYGTTYRMEVSGFDPHDPFRGRYLAFSMPNTARSELELNGTTAYVTLRNASDGTAYFDVLSGEKPQKGDYLKVNAYGYGGMFRAPFERFYLNEKIAPDAERILQSAFSGPARKRAEIVLRVHRGFACLEDLQIDGTSIVTLAREKMRRK